MYSWFEDMGTTNIEDEVFSRLSELNLGQLLNVHGELQLPELTDQEKQMKSSVLKKILKYLSSDELSNLDDSGLATFLVIKTFMDTQGIKDEPGVGVEKPSEVATNGTNDTVVEKSTADLVTLRKYLKKDFKINGTGLPGQKDRIKFSHLAYSINNGEKKGYSDEEICEEIIRAISLDISLRGFLEDESLVQTQFLRSLIRGLRNNNIRNELKALLSPATDDEELLELLNKAVSAENERQSKWKKSEKISEVTIASSECLTKPETKPKKDNHNPILNELREMKVQLNEVAAMKDEIADLKKQLNQKMKFRSRVKFGCSSCKENNVRKCTHCFNCGGSDHIRAECPSLN